MIRTLTLAPNRKSVDAVFPQGSRAYVFTNRTVRLNGEVVLANPQHIACGDDGLLWAELIPCSLVDDGLEFKYHISVYDPQGLIIWTASVVMPDQDINVWELIPERVDKDRVAITEGLEPELEPQVVSELVYCGIAPEEPIGPISATPIYSPPFNDLPADGLITTQDYDNVGDRYGFRLDRAIVAGGTYDLMLHTTPVHMNGADEDSLNGVLWVQQHPYPSTKGWCLHSVEDGGNYQLYDYTHLLRLGDTRLVKGSILRLHVQTTPTDGYANQLHVLQIYTPNVMTEAERDQTLIQYGRDLEQYDIYNLCIANGGVAGEKP